jgi:hypothetical protein
MEWIINTFNIYPTIESIEVYIKYYHKIDVLKFLYNKNIEGNLPFDFDKTINYIINSFMYFRIIKSGHYDTTIIKIFDFLYNETTINIKYDSYINILIEEDVDNNDLLKWLIDHKTYKLIKEIFS